MEETISEAQKFKIKKQNSKMYYTTFTEHTNILKKISTRLKKEKINFTGTEILSPCKNH